MTLVHIEDPQASDPIEGGDLRLADHIYTLCGELIRVLPDGETDPAGADWVSYPGTSATCPACKAAAVLRISHVPDEGEST